MTSTSNGSRRLLMGFIGVALLCAARARGGAAYAPPDANPDAASEVRAVEREVAGGQFAAGARRLDALLERRADELFETTPGVLVSAWAWVGQLPAGARRGLAVEARRAAGEAAGRLLESARRAAPARPEELYAVARRYPLTEAAGAALVEAGDRSLQLGDLPGAQAYFELAVRGGAALGATRAARLELLRKVNVGAPVAGGGRRAPFAGPLPFDAPWFGQARYAPIAKVFPVAFGDRIVVNTWRGTWMMTAAGRVLWATPNPKGPGSFSTDRPTQSGRGVGFAPAVLRDVEGRPATVVVRQPGARGNDQYALRAMSAADGRVLWTSEETDQRKDVTYAGLPAVAGRYAYALGVAKTNQSSGQLILSAVEVTSGAPLWQTSVGTLMGQAEARPGQRKAIRNEPLVAEDFAEWSEPAVSGDLVIASPNCGAVIAAGRFDGRVRWVHVYRSPEVPNAERVRRRDGEERWQEEAARERAALAMARRYGNTPVECAGVVVAMPQDVGVVMGFDRASGVKLWETDLLEGFGLAGAAAGRVITCGTDGVAGVDPATGKLAWRTSKKLTGPAVVVGETVLAPTAGGVVQLGASDGKERGAVYAVPALEKALAAEGVRQLVAESGAGRALGVGR